VSELLECIEVETGPDPDASIIWLHGLGADGNDFLPIVDEMDLGGHSIRFVFPHAPPRAVTINGGYVMRAWYDIVSVDLVRREDEAGVRTSAGQVRALIDREIGRGSVAGHILLAGFSQGGAIALFTGLTHAHRLGGIAALSTYLPLSGAVTAERHPSNHGVPIFMAHGTQDPVVIPARAEASRDLLQSLGYQPAWHTYSMPHSVCGEEIADISAWVRRTLA